jgi:hypothetical protein
VTPIIERLGSPPRSGSRRNATILLIVLTVVCGLTGIAAAQTPAPDSGRLYGRAEYLLWWTKNSPTPVPLVSDDVLGPGTRVLLGGEDIDLGHRNGARFTLGYWLTGDRAWGVEATGFFLATATERRGVSSSGAIGTGSLLIPFVDPTLPGENVTNLSLAGEFAGAATETLRSRLWGVELNGVRPIGGQGPFRVELLGGFRYLRFSEDYRFRTSSPDVPPGPVTVFMTRDEFDAGNSFYGAQLGVRGRYDVGPFTADAGVKLALGVMRESVDIAGSLATNQFTVPTVAAYPGGYFAQPTNIGSYGRNVFAVVPEANFNLGYRLTSWASIVAGYSFLYASNVVRPGEQIDRTVNPTQSPSFGGPVPTNLVGAARPRFRFEGSDFWAHGLNFGVVLQY